MKKEEEAFRTSAEKIKGAEAGQLFGKPCYKLGGKAFVCFFQEQMVFKLGGEEHATALSLKGSILFDPGGKKRPMKEWVQVPFSHAKRWPELAKAAAKYIG